MPNAADDTIALRCIGADRLRAAAVRFGGASDLPQGRIVGPSSGCDVRLPQAEKLRYTLWLATRE